MQYALVDGRRLEAQPGLGGQCPICRSPVIPRCGEIRVPHWAHRAERSCDVWWEPETAWHREWKEYFPLEWREFIRQAPNGEKHIADIQTPSGRVVEFQHSFLNPDERRDREAFYGNMIWVVDGMRRQRDRERFVRAAMKWQDWGTERRIFVTRFAREGLPNEWVTSSVPVCFDFGVDRFPWDTHKTSTHSLWCLLPQRPAGNAIIAEIPKTVFITRCRTGRDIIEAQLVKIISDALVLAQRLDWAALRSAYYRPQRTWRGWHTWKLRRRRYARF